MIRQMVDAVEAEHTGMYVAADDTDVSVLLKHYYLVRKISLLFIMERERGVIDICKTAFNHRNIATSLCLLTLYLDATLSLEIFVWVRVQLLRC